MKFPIPISRIERAMLQNNQPFFSNDIAGVIKVVVSLGGVAAVVITAIVKWGQSGFAKRLDVIESDLNGVGTKINTLEAGCTSSGAKQEELKDRFTRKEVTIDQMMVDIGTLKGETRALERADTNLMADLREFIVTSFSERDKKTELMGKEIVELRTKLEERENSRELIREILELSERRIRDGGGD